MPSKRPDLEERDRRRGEEFRRRLEALLRDRAAHGDPLSHAKIGKKASIERTTITKMLNGARLATAEQILGIAAALGEPDLVPEEMRPGATAVLSPQGSPRMSASGSRLPPGLEGFLERHGKRLNITKRLRSYLENDRTQTESWIVKDDAFWERRFKYWREELAIQDQAPGVGGEEDHP